MVVKDRILVDAAHDGAVQGGLVIEVCTTSPESPAPQNEIGGVFVEMAFSTDSGTAQSRDDYASHSDVVQFPTDSFGPGPGGVLCARNTVPFTPVADDEAEGRVTGCVNRRFRESPKFARRAARGEGPCRGSLATDHRRGDRRRQSPQVS